MTTEDTSNAPASRQKNLIPWIITAAALLLYAIMLQHWVTIRSLPVAGIVAGWDWHPLPLAWRPVQVYPLFLILTAPARILPASLQPLALNAFAALCASLTLGLLAASIRLLPHDRTRDQRQREGGAYALLSIPLAFIPPIFAAVMLGMQLTFWHNAVAASVDMLDLLVFATLIYCLLKFRISQHDGWLAGFTFVYGLGVTNNWALIGFFPVFLVAMIWIKGVTLFNLRLLSRLAVCGLAGLLLYLLVPTMASLGADRANFFSVLHMELGAQSYHLRLVPRWVVLVASLPTILPLLVAGIRWPSFEGEVSAAGNMLTKYMFRALHVVFLLLALVLFFDYKYSPSQRLQDQPASFLTFYYMAALAVGYYSGYVLLIFGKSAAQGWERSSPLTKIFNQVIVGALCLLAIAAPCALIVQNGPAIGAGRTSALADYADEILRELPAKQAVLLTDDATQHYLIQAALARSGNANNYILISTGPMQRKEYISFLVSHYPELKKLTVAPEKLPDIIPPVKIVEYLYALTQKFPVYYLHPSFGYYFEIFYLRPHGLVYDLRNYPKDVMVPPVLTADEINANEEVWNRLGKGPLATLPKLAKLDPDVNAMCVNYSVSLNWLGVEAQKANFLPQANALFAQAIKANPQNILAKINKDYNERLQKGDHRGIDTGDYIFKAMMAYHGLEPLLKYNGSVDEPDLDLTFGELMAQGKDYRQSAILFDRRLQLLPGDPAAELDMTKTFVDWGLPDKAIDWVRKLRANPAVKRWDVARVEALAYYAKNDFPTAEKLMVSALQESPSDENRVEILAEFYRVTGEAALRENRKEEAGRRFTNALVYVNNQLQLLGNAHYAPDSREMIDATMKKAEIQTMLKAYPDSIKTLGQILEVQPGNPTAVLNRAIAEVQINDLDDATTDYKKMRKLLPKQPYLSDYGLAEVAGRKTNRTEEIHYLKRFLDTAPPNSPEVRQVKAHLKKLENP
jgi:tetratricopeptide (TPR) repeat protein